MRRHRAVRVLMLLPLGLAAIAVFGVVVMSLWNWLLPPLFNVKSIGFWQALGVLLLSRMLFGGFGGGHHRRHSGGMGARWERMTPEEREQVRQGLRERCGSVAPPPADAR